MQHEFSICIVVAPASGSFLRLDKRNVSISHPIHICYMFRPSDLLSCDNSYKIRVKCKLRRLSLCIFIHNPTPCHYSIYVQIFSLYSFIQPPSIAPLCPDILTIQFYPTAFHCPLMSRYSHYTVLSNRLPLPPYVQIFSLYSFIQPPAITLFYVQIFFQHPQTLSRFHAHSNDCVQRHFCTF